MGERFLIESINLETDLVSKQIEVIAAIKFTDWTWHFYFWELKESN